MRRTVARVAAVAGLAAGVDAARAAPVQRFAIVQEIAFDAHAPLRRQDEFLDTSFYVVWPRQHLTVTLGSFANGAEWGAYARDARGSAYSVALRRRQGAFLSDTSLDLQTEQRASRCVLSAGLRGFWPDEPEAGNLLLVPSAGFQMYYRRESYVSVLAARDPRRGTGTTFRVANRWTHGSAYLEAALAPRTDGVVNYSCSARWGVLTLGYARERDFDFTRLDRRVFWFGFLYDLHP